MFPLTLCIRLFIMYPVGYIFTLSHDNKTLRKGGDRLTRLKEIRISKRLTQKALAELVGVTRVTIARYEIGDRDPKGATLVRIARALGVTTSDLLGA